MLVEGLVTLLAEAEWNVYVDWSDPMMPATPTRETARRIQDKIRETNFFLFLATPNSLASRWCPWEIGYADGKKPVQSIIVVPTHSGGQDHGNEYLGLYRRLEFSANDRLAVWEPGQDNGMRLRAV
jgi:hypothetical protein